MVRRAGERSRFAVVVVEGRVHLVADGIVLAEMGPGSVVDASPAPGQRESAPATLVAATDAIVFLVDRRYLATAIGP